VAGRADTALESMVGFFVNTLVLRTNVAGDPPFSDIVDRVKAFDLDAYEHQDVPFEQVVEALRPERTLSRHPLFQVMLTLQNVPPVAVSLEGLSVEIEPFAGTSAKFDLTFDLTEHAGLHHEPLGITGVLG